MKAPAKNAFLLPPAVVLFVTVFGSCTTFSSRPAEVPAPAPAPSAKPPEASAPVDESAGKKVKASYYGEGDGLSGKKTASGEKFNPESLTAAHKTLPFGTKVEVKNPENGKKVTVRVNDRGPFTKGRQLDVSAKAAKELGIKDKGVTPVEMKVVETPGAKPPAEKSAAE